MPTSSSPNYRAAVDGHEGEVLHHSLDGTRSYRVLFSPVLRDGQVVAAVAISRDITEWLAVERALAEREHDFRMLAEQSADMVARMDLDGRYTYVSPSCRPVTGWGPDELLGQSAYDRVHPGDVPAARLEHHRLLDGAPEGLLEQRHRTPDGAYRWLETHIKVLRDADGGLRGLQASVRDVSERRAVEDALRASEQRFRVAFGDAPIGMAIVTPDGRIERVNRALCEFLHYDEAELLRRGFQDVTHADDLAADVALLEEVLAGQRRGYELEKRYVRSDGEVVWGLLWVGVLPAPDGAPESLLAQVVDITERKRHQERLLFLADHDALTGLWNRRRFEQELAGQIARCRRYDERAALVVLDLDHFKDVNDLLGHAAGDELLRRIGQALREVLRESDAAARLGGDEFAVLLSHLPPDRLAETSQKLLDAVRGAATELAGRTVRPTASAGVMALDAATSSGPDALVDADLAMYEAKRSGRDRISARAEAGHGRDRADSSLYWSDLLRRAVAERRLELYAQPVVDVATGRPELYELLLRLRTDDGHLAQPSDFLYVADRFGLLPELDRWVLRQAAALLADHHWLRLSVNLSARTVSDRSTPTFVEHAIAEAGGDPSRLVVELTESEALAHVERAQLLGRKLQRLGAGLALDDFGTGFASFAYLQSLPASLLKIDGQFIRGLAQNRGDRLLVRSLVELCRGMGVRTVAECVENAGAADQVRELGVDLGQGLWYAPPRPVSEIVRPRRR
ncbi:MAG: EAL domain-containing protein [Solirubrobacterales bacterium]|nr:EAL domain-containing protein [Solirubrobacterales bacterium]